MQRAVEEYRVDDDPMRRFLRDQCQEQGARDAGGKIIETSIKDLYERFEKWHEDEIGTCYIKRAAFSKGVQETRGINAVRKKDGYYLPVAVNEQEVKLEIAEAGN